MTDFLALVVVIASSLGLVVNFTMREAELLRAFNAESMEQLWRQLGSSSKMIALVVLGLLAEAVGLALALVVLL